MTEQQMPARIWASTDPEMYKNGILFTFQNGSHSVAYTRSDIAERMAEALEKTALVCSGDTVTKRGLVEALESARSALSAFRSSTQDTGARHD